LADLSVLFDDEDRQRRLIGKMRSDCCCCRQSQNLLILSMKKVEGSRLDDKIQSAPIDEG
jgi:hypothetical protein